MSNFESDKRIPRWVGRAALVPMAVGGTLLGVKMLGGDTTPFQTESSVAWYYDQFGSSLIADRYGIPGVWGEPIRARYDQFMRDFAGVTDPAVLDLSKYGFQVYDGQSSSQLHFVPRSQLPTHRLDWWRFSPETKLIAEALSIREFFPGSEIRERSFQYELLINHTAEQSYPWMYGNESLPYLYLFHGETTVNLSVHQGSAPDNALFEFSKSEIVKGNVFITYFPWGNPGIDVNGTGFEEYFSVAEMWAELQNRFPTIERTDRHPTIRSVAEAMMESLDLGVAE